MNRKPSLRNLLTQLGGRSLPPEYDRLLQAMAEREGVSPADLAESLLEEALRQRRAAESVQARWNKLTRREQQVVRLMCQGAGNREIAGQFFISPSTVRIHLRNILMK